MDCRRTVLLSLGLLGAAAGCQSQPTQSTTSAYPGFASGTSGALAPPIDMNKVKKEAPVKPYPASANVDVRLGTMWVLESSHPSCPPLVRQHLREQARQAFQEALAQNPKYLPAYQALGQLYQTLDDHAHAVETFKKALAIAPQQGALWYDLGMCHKQAREWDQAIFCLRQAVQREPENRLYVHMLGYTLALCGRTDQSLACFTRVDGEARAHFNLARLLQRLNRPEESRQQLELALQQNPNLTDARDLLNALDNPAPSDKVRTVSHVEGDADPDPDVMLISHRTARPAPNQPAAEAKKTPLLIPPPPSLKKGDNSAPDS